MLGEIYMRRALAINPLHDRVMSLWTYLQSIFPSYTSLPSGIHSLNTRRHRSLNDLHDLVCVDNTQIADEEVGRGVAGTDKPLYYSQSKLLSTSSNKNKNQKVKVFTRLIP